MPSPASFTWKSPCCDPWLPSPPGSAALSRLTVAYAEIGHQYPTGSMTWHAHPVPAQVQPHPRIPAREPSMTTALPFSTDRTPGSATSAVRGQPCRLASARRGSAPPFIGSRFQGHGISRRRRCPAPPAARFCRRPGPSACRCPPRCPAGGHCPRPCHCAFNCGTVSVERPRSPRRPRPCRTARPVPSPHPRGRRPATPRPAAPTPGQADFATG
jgi:hypothetical protein